MAKKSKMYVCKKSCDCLEPDSFIWLNGSYTRLLTYTKITDETNDAVKLRFRLDYAYNHIIEAWLAYSQIRLFKDIKAVRIPQWLLYEKIKENFRHVVTYDKKYLHVNST